MQLEVEIFEEVPSTSVFSQIESKNIPAVFQGCIKEWKAFTHWNPANGGLDYLQERVGSLNVEAMLSRTAPVFYGDLRSHERVPLPFSSFIQLCKQRLGTASEEDHDHLLSGVAPEQIYLAQVPIMNIEDQERVQLPNLWEDIQLPAFLETKEVASVNLWMNNANARSSAHYDPHHNILCVVAGQKEVVLWPPSSSPFLYPMPIYGEASNHSSVALESPDLLLYPRAESVMEYSHKVILHAGDALFIPEGWFHQVDSEDLTIAVNIWWRSNIMSSMLEHMDSYYLRRILRRLTDRELDRTTYSRRLILDWRNRIYIYPSCSVVEGKIKVTMVWWSWQVRRRIYLGKTNNRELICMYWNPLLSRLFTNLFLWFTTTLT